MKKLVVVAAAVLAAVAATAGAGRAVPQQEIGSGTQNPEVDESIQDAVEEPSPNIHAMFGLSRPSDGPFPSNRFTVEDGSNLTGLRVKLPLPNCEQQPSDCDDIGVLNDLDGFNLQPRISIPFDGAIDPATAISENVFLVDIDGDATVGINQVVWDPDTSTLHVESDELLRQHARYAVIVTRNVRDTRGRHVKSTEAFRNFLDELCAAELCTYQRALLDGLAAAHRFGTPRGHVASASVFTTLSSTAVMEKIRDQIKAETPAPIDFVLAGGRRTVFARNAVSEIWFDQQTQVNGPLRPVRLDLALLNVVPGAVGQIAYGKFSSRDYQIGRAVWPVIGTRTGALPTNPPRNEIYCTLLLPSGDKPAAGWPVMIFGHGGNSHKDDFALRHAAIAASYGLATLEINAVGHGFGAGSRLRVLADGSAVTFPSGGRGIDVDRNGVIGTREGDRPAASHALQWERDSLRQTAADLLQLVRQVEIGVDVDGDGTVDLDPSRIYVAGFSLGSNHAALAATVEPSVRALVVNAEGGGLSELFRISPGRRPVFGTALGSRRPSLLNGPGIDVLDGVPVGPPTWNENKPARNLPPVVNDVRGAMAIQDLIDRTEWALQSGNSLAYAHHLRREPLVGVPAKSVLVQFARGDQISPNPAMTTFLRTGGLADRATFYRNELSARDSGVQNYPHPFLNNPTTPNAVARAVARGAQHQMAAFFESDGVEILTAEELARRSGLPEIARLFEVPIKEPLPEALSFVP